MFARLEQYYIKLVAVHLSAQFAHNILTAIGIFYQHQVRVPTATSIKQALHQANRLTGLRVYCRIVQTRSGLLSLH